MDSLIMATKLTCKVIPQSAGLAKAGDQWEWEGQDEGELCPVCHHDSTFHGLSGVGMVHIKVIVPLTSSVTVVLSIFPHCPSFPISNSDQTCCFHLVNRTKMTSNAWQHLINAHNLFRDWDKTAIQVKNVFFPQLFFFSCDTHHFSKPVRCVSFLLKSADSGFLGKPKKRRYTEM